jgi:hypothetical protein
MYGIFSTRVNGTEEDDAKVILDFEKEKTGSFLALKEFES